MPDPRLDCQILSHERFVATKFAQFIYAQPRVPFIRCTDTTPWFALLYKVRTKVKGRRVKTTMITEKHIYDYLRHLQENYSRAQVTRKGYEQQLLHFLRQKLPMTKEAVASYLCRAADGSALAASTRNHRLMILGGFFRYLVAEGQFHCDPTAGIMRARIPKTLKTRLTIDDLRRALQMLVFPSAWNVVRDNCLIRLLFYTGLRISELARLDLDQVELDFMVLRKVIRKGGSEMDIPLNQAATGAASQWLAVRPPCTSSAFILNRYKKRLSVRMIQKRLKELGELAALPAALTPHAIRHLHATALNNVGVPTEVIRQSLNHESLVTTQRYLHSGPDVLRAALERLPQLFPESYGKQKSPEK